jgi:hypothetical protein
MNLLIAVISDTFAKTMASIKQASNSQMSDVLLELETFLFWKRKDKEIGYCVFAEEVDEKDDEDEAATERESNQEAYRSQTTETLENITKMLKLVLKEVKSD